jgi:hypothetical protein
MVLLMDSDIAGERFILNSENLDYKNAFSYIANSLNVTGPKKELNYHIANLACKLEKIRSLVLGKKPKITEETIAIGFKRLQYSSDKIKQKLGIDFIQMKQSIEETVKLFLKDNYRNEEVD